MSCRFHSGKPIFHDLKKGWSCCNAAAYEWSEFEKLEGCCIGPHSDEKTETEFWQSSTVAHATNGIIGDIHLIEFDSCRERENRSIKNCS